MVFAIGEQQQDDRSACSGMKCLVLVELSAEQASVERH